MATRFVVLAIVGFASVVIAAIPERISGQAFPVTAEIDVVVTDKTGKVVDGLTADDFDVREAGRPVVITSFSSVDLDRDTGSHGRVVVLLFDDVGTITQRTPAMIPGLKTVAQAFVDKMRPQDSIALLPLSANGGKAQMSPEEASQVIGLLKLAPSMLDERGVGIRILRHVSAVSRQMSSLAHQRKIVVFAGPAEYFDPNTNQNIGGDWATAITAAWRGMVAVYVVDPTEFTRTKLRPSFRPTGPAGLAGETGGYVFVGSSVRDRAVEQIWQEAGHYYLLGYSTTARDAPRLVDVKAKRSGLSVRGRNLAGMP